MLYLSYMHYIGSALGGAVFLEAPWLSLSSVSTAKLFSWHILAGLALFPNSSFEFSGILHVTHQICDPRTQGSLGFTSYRVTWQLRM